MEKYPERKTELQEDTEPSNISQLLSKYDYDLIIKLLNELIDKENNKEPIVLPEIPTIPEVIDNLSSYSSTNPLSANQGRILNNKFNVDYIVEIGSNSNGNYIKYNSGLMICYKKVTFTNISKNRSWNGRYISNSSLSLGNFAKTFVEVPTVSITLTSPYSVLFMGDMVPSTSSAGTFYPLGFNSDVIGNMVVNVIAYGQWK